MSRYIAYALTAFLIAAAPAHAQGFGVFFGDEESDFYAPPQRITCMTDRQIRDAVAAEGFSNIYLNVPNDGHVEVRATIDGWVYLLEYDFCRGYIEEARRLRPAS